MDTWLVTGRALPAVKLPKAQLRIRPDDFEERLERLPASIRKVKTRHLKTRTSYIVS